MGVLAFEMVAGRPPFDGTEFIRILTQHAQEPVPDLSELRADLPVPLKLAIEKLLAKSPSDRFDSASDFIEQAFPTVEYAMEAPSAGASGSILARLFSLFSAKTHSDRPAPPVPSAPPYAMGVVDVSQTVPPGTVIAPIPQLDLIAPGRIDEEGYSPDATMIVSVAPQDPGREWQGPDIDTDVPVALMLVSSPDPGEIGRRVTLHKFPFIIGRGKDAGFSLNGDSGISRKHLEINYHDGAFRIRDFSTNGAFVNGFLLLHGSENVLLFGDIITLSVQSSLRFIADIPRLPDLSGVLLDDRYELGEQLHSSLKAATYFAQDRHLPRTLTVKIFSPSLSALSDYRGAYQREADLAAKLSHPHIRKVIDRGEAETHIDGKACRLPYLCMDVMKGGNLNDRLTRSDTPLDLAILLGWIKYLSEALSYAHNSGVIHGGLKPGAILFDDCDNPFLADFAHARATEATSSSLVLGSPAFMAPEQWDGQQPTEASDQYALACLVYLMLSGSIPHEGQSDPRTRRRNFERGARPVHEQAQLGDGPVIAGAVSKVIEKAMSLEFEQRYATIEEFSLALEFALSAGRGSDGQPRVFLSYRRQSSAGWAVLFARELLEKHVIQVFVDTQRRDNAINFPDKLRNAIADCDVFVCLLADDTLESTWVREEIRLAYEKDRPMVPVFQESYHGEGDHDEACIKALLRYDGVHLLDRRNIHVDHTISELVEIVKGTFGA